MDQGAYLVVEASEEEGDCSLTVWDGALATVQVMKLERLRFTVLKEGLDQGSHSKSRKESSDHKWNL